MAARPAIDSVMPRIRGASCKPVNSQCPVRSELIFGACADFVF